MSIKACATFYIFKMFGHIGPILETVVFMTHILASCLNTQYLMINELKMVKLSSARF